MPPQKTQGPVTVTGCLSSADKQSGAAGTSGSTGQATGTPREDGQFLLTNARITSGAAAGTSGAAGTGGTGAAGSTTSTANNRFVLIGGNQQELKQYLNSEVEIRGTLQPRSDSDRGAAATGSATGSAQRSPQGDVNANLQRLRVTSVKQTAKTCSGGQ